MFFAENTPAGSETVSLRDFGASHEFPPPKQSSSKITFAGKYTTMEFEIDSRKLLFNKTLIWLNAPATKNGNDLTIAKYDAHNTIKPLLRLNMNKAVTNAITVMIDPGHGGKETGAIGPRKACEKKITLDIANSVKRKLENQQITVKLTRKWDTALSRADRINEAKKQKADMFISIHINSAVNIEASGIETYILPGPDFASTAGKSMDNKASPANRFDNANIQLAYCIHRQLLASTGASDRGIRRARFDVLQDAICPAILVECGFVSNPADEAKLTKKIYREALADGIAKGVLALINPLSTTTKPMLLPEQKTPLFLPNP